MSGEYKLTEGYPFDGAAVQVNVGPAPLAGGKRVGSGVDGELMGARRRKLSRRGGEELMGARRRKLSRRGGQDSSSPLSSPEKKAPAEGQEGARRSRRRRRGGQPVPPSGQDGARRSRRRRH